MDAEEFRKAGYAAIDRIIEYNKNLDNVKPLSQVQPSFLLDQLTSTIPQEGENWEKIQNDIEEKIMPGITHWQSPNFFAFFPANSSFPGILHSQICICTCIYIYI